MIKRVNEMEMEIKQNMRGGKGSIELTHIYKQEELTGKARLCAKVVINPGCSIGLHDHVNEEEIYIILKGKGVVTDNGVSSEVGPGDSILTGGGASHSIENFGDEPLELLAVILLFQ